MWTSLNIGISFSNPQGIRGQLEGKIANPQVRPSGLKHEYSEEQVPTSNNASAHPQKLTEHQHFNALKSFYKEQLLTSDANQSSSALDVAFSSPSSLARLMNLYGTGGGLLSRKANKKASVMREALTQAEGLQTTSTETQQALRSKDQDFSYDDTPTPSQLSFQYPSPIGNPHATHISQLKPMPTLLRTKRAKRCAACKHILVRPELKITSTRYRIKLIALNYIPYITLKSVPGSDSLILPAGPDGDPKVRLPPGKPSQWILTLRNPLYENITVSLGSPSITPGKHAHKVTILCPEFDVGKNSDAWDDALRPEIGLPKSDTQVSMGLLGGEQIAGKVYDRGRNWTSIVIEVVPASIVTAKGEVVEEDEDVVEVPIRVRLEWKVTDEQVLEDSKTRRKDGVEDNEEVDDGSRELAYWMVLGIGRVGV